MRWRGAGEGLSETRRRPPPNTMFSPLLFLLLVVFLEGSRATEPVNSSSDLQLEAKKEICFEILGCFSMDNPWWTVKRVVPPPDTPERISTQLFLFTRESTQRTKPVELRPRISFMGVGFDPQKPIIFIIHGLASHSRAPWMIDLKDAFLQKMDANVYLTDWAPGAAELLRYSQAVSNTRIVAAEMRRFIVHLMTVYQVKPENIHLVGHSLGAQVSAYIGKKIMNISRITALDPAQPFFEGHNRLVRLDQRDATFVEVVHTDAKPTIPLFGMGMVRQHGDVDYYINGGFAQPGCSVPSPFPEINSLLQFCQLQISVISKLASCAHNRATQVYLESLRNNNCTFWGHPGHFIETFLEAVTAHYSDEYLPPRYEKCTTNTCSPLNLNNVKYPARGSFVVPSARHPPFCILEPDVDGSMGNVEKALEKFRNYTENYSISVRESIAQSVGSMTRSVSRKVSDLSGVWCALETRELSTKRRIHNPALCFGTNLYLIMHLKRNDAKQFYENLTPNYDIACHVDGIDGPLEFTLD